MTMKKRLTAFLMALVMAVCLVPATAFASTMAAMTVSVDMTAAGKGTMTFEVEPTNTVLHLKDEIETGGGTPVGWQTLVYNGNELKNDDTLQSCNLQQGSTVVLQINKSVSLGTSGIKNNDVVYFGIYNKTYGEDGNQTTAYNVPWYVVNLNTTNKTAFMLSRYCLEDVKFRTNRGYYSTDTN